MRRIPIYLGLSLVPFFAMGSFAQPIPTANNLTQTNVFELAPEQFLINGGVLSNDGRNLFHNFDSFNLDANQAAIFLNSPNAANLFSTISGGTPSLIDGLIGVSRGNPNLYFINPAGIIFGENAQLNVPGDFIATTSTALGFENDWLNAIGSSDFASLVGEPIQFAFNVNGTVGDILVQGNIEAPGDVGLIGGRIQGDRRISSSQDVLISTVNDLSIIRLQQPGNLLSLELDTASLDRGNQANFAINQLPELLTGNGDIQLNEVAAQYGIIAAEGELTLNNSLLQTKGHLALLGQGITTNSTASNSGLNQFLISGDLADIYATQKPFLTAIANKINFTIESEPINGTPIVVTDDLIDSVDATTLNAADIRLENSQFTGQNIYILGDNVNLFDSKITAMDTTSIFGQNINVREGVLNSDQNFSLKANNILIEGGTWDANNISLLAKDTLVLQEFDSTTNNNSGLLESPLNITANQLDFQGDNLIEIYLSEDSIIKSVADISLINANTIRVTGVLETEGDLNITAGTVDIGLNIDRLGELGSSSNRLGGNDKSAVVIGEKRGLILKPESPTFADFSLGGRLIAQGDINLNASNILTLGDSPDDPLNLEANNIVLSGENNLFYDSGLLVKSKKRLFSPDKQYCFVR